MASAAKTQQTPASGQRAPSAAKPAARTPSPPAASPARALQQRVGNQGAQALIQQKAAGAQQDPKQNAGLARSSELVDVSGGTFSPSQKVQDEIRANPKGLPVRVAAKGVAGEGSVMIEPVGKTAFRSVGMGSMPLLGEWSQMFGQLYLNVAVASTGQVTGNVSLKQNNGPSQDWLKFLQDNAGLLGGAGLKVGKLPTAENKFENGKLILGVKKLQVEVGGFLSAEFNIESVNAAKPTIDATAKIKIGGVAEGDLAISNAAGPLQGQVSLAVTFSTFNGSVLVKYNPDGSVDIGGKAAYNANKLSGEIEFIVTDKDTANKFAKDAIAAAGGINKVQDASPPAPVPPPKTKERGLAATGQLTFNLTQWFAGTVNVVVDGMGQVTVIGKIAPPGEILLFPQKNFDKELVNLEVKAYYGIPVVGNLNLFAGITLTALAMLGPAKLYKIEVLGTYSTDPTVQKNIQISGSINISAYAGLRLTASGGAGIEILDHDLKFGIGINADVGVKAYAEARPTFGFREPGEFYISGTLEMVAQPMLGLNGEFFIKLDAPWWSPLSDEKWAWPLFSKEWPMTDPIGINATVKDYVLGSGKVPEIELKKPEFDASKFMTSMVDNKLPAKTGKPGEGQGTFKDDGSVQKTDLKLKNTDSTKTDKKTDKKVSVQGGQKSAKQDPNAQNDLAATKALKSGLDGLKTNQPYSGKELNNAIGKLKKPSKNIKFIPQPKGDKWIVIASDTGAKKNAGQIELTAKKEGAVPADGQKGLAALDAITNQYAAKGATSEEMTKAIDPLKAKFGFKSLTVKQKGEFWHFNYELPAKGTKQGPKVADAKKGTKLQRAKQFVKDKVKAVLQWWKKRTNFTAGGETHELYFTGTEKAPQLMVASSPQLVSTFIKNITPREPNKDKKVKAIAAINVQLDFIKVEVAKPVEDQDRDAIAKAFDKIGKKLPDVMDIEKDSKKVGKIEVERPSFTEKVRKLLVVNADEEDRRHIVSSQDMAAHYEKCLEPKMLSSAATLLLERGQPVEKPPLSSEKIEKAAKQRHRQFFNDVHNLFVGDLEENRSLGQKIDPNKPGMGKVKLKEHIQYIKDRWSLEPEKLKVTGYRG